MTAKPIGTFARNCFLLIFVLWLAVFCFASGSSVESVPSEPEEKKLHGLLGTLKAHMSGRSAALSSRYTAF